MTLLIAFLFCLGCDDGGGGGSDDTSTDSSVDSCDDTSMDPVEEEPAADTLDDVPVDVPSEDMVEEGPFTCEPPAEAGSLYELSAHHRDRDEDVSMCEYRGHVILVVNVAALCGFTSQFGDLAQLQTDFGDQGFEVVGFYSNQFMNQAGTLEQQLAAEELYGVNFDIYSIVNVNPPDEHPVFTWLKSQPGADGAVEWNFEKWLVSHDGELLARWRTGTNPDSIPVRSAIMTALSEMD